MSERIVATAIERNGVVHRGSQEGHWRLRAHLGDDDPTKTKPGDIDGFMTSEGRFVGRREANHIAAESGQCPLMGRDMLSSDITWDAKPPRDAKAVPAYPQRKRMFRP